MFTTPPACHLGTLIDRRYRLQRVVGEGASSWVFAADDLRLDREVALKLFKPPSSQHDLKLRKRCIKEGQTLAKLVHPHIVAIYDASEDGSGQSYLVMELCEAGTLEAELAQRCKLDALASLKLILPLMGAVAFAHDRSIIHRDIKPGNIVIIHGSEESRAKLLDFGISLGPGGRVSSDLVLGTPSYMAPEQARGEPAKPATDVWALGVVLYRCLTGELPFQADNDAALLHKIANERAPSLVHRTARTVPPNLALVLGRALERDLERRFRDVRSFAHAIATAAALDSLPLPARPEPIGLPLFERWFAEARASERTRDLGSPCKPSRLRAEPAAAPTHRARHLALAAALLAVTGASATLTYAAGERAKRAQIKPMASRIDERTVNVSAPARTVTVQEIAFPANAGSLGHAEPTVSAPTALDPDRSRSTSKTAKRKSPVDVERVNGTRSSSAHRGQRRLLTDWDWQ